MERAIAKPFTVTTSEGPSKVLGLMLPADPSRASAFAKEGEEEEYEAEQTPASSSESASTEDSGSSMEGSDDTALKALLTAEDRQPNMASVPDELMPSFPVHGIVRHRKSLVIHGKHELRPSTRLLCGRGWSCEFYQEFGEWPKIPRPRCETCFRRL